MASAGRVLLMPKGTWTANTAYTALDFVYYGGNSYVCKAAVSGTTNPTNDTAHWQQMASGFDSDLITQTITNEPNHIASDAAVYAECQKLEAVDDHFREDLASVEEAATSALVYSAGDYLMYQDQLYKAITNIAVGDPLVSGTNIRLVTVGEEMADLAASGASNMTAISQYAADMASVETTTSASKAYSIGEYLMLAGQLYKVTAAIASGGTLEVGTNITAVNLGDQLKSLNDSLTNLASRSYIVTQLVTCTYMSNTQLSGTYTSITVPDGYSSRIAAIGNGIVNNPVGAKTTGKFLSSTGNQIRVIGSGFTPTDTFEALVIFEVFKT